MIAFVEPRQCTIMGRPVEVVPGKPARYADEEGGLVVIEPTDDERRNGWNATTLTAYTVERAIAASDAIDWQKRKPARPRATNSGYRRFRR